VHVLVGGSDGATLFPFEQVRRRDDQDSWSVVDQPRGDLAHLGHAAVLPDGRLLIDVEDWHGDLPPGLYVSSGADWASYERVEAGAPFDGKPRAIDLVDLRVDEHGATLTAIGPDRTSAWVTEDSGVTWTRRPPADASARGVPLVSPPGRSRR
jgi:hypothetical protein